MNIATTTGPSNQRIAARRCLAPALALALALAAPSVHADIDAGWRAYQDGDFATALTEWQPLADSGDARAQYNLGVMHDEGKGVARDRALAVSWWRRAAEQDFAPAQHNVANSYIAGEGV